MEWDISEPMPIDQAKIYLKQKASNGWYVSSAPALAISNEQGALVVRIVVVSCKRPPAKGKKKKA